jgi:hypothetical protein
VSCAAPDSANLLPSSLTAYRVSLAEGIVEDEVPLSVVDDRRHVGTTAPGVCDARQCPGAGTALGQNLSVRSGPNLIGLDEYGLFWLKSALEAPSRAGAFLR